MAVSLYHQGYNIDRERVAELTDSPVKEVMETDLWLPNG